MAAGLARLLMLASGMTTCMGRILFLAVFLAAGSGCNSGEACQALGLCADSPDGSTTMTNPTTIDGGAPEPSTGMPLPFVPSNLGKLDTTSGTFGDLVMNGGCAFSYRDDRKARCGDRELVGYRSLEVTQSDGSKILVFIARNIRIPGSSISDGASSDAIALVALDTIEVSGTLTVAGDHNNATAGGAPGNGLTMNEQGKGPGGGQPGEGGGGGAYCGKGGGGGGPGGGAGGVAFGTPTLVPLVGGSAGGRGLSGAGGGALMLVAGNRVVVSTTGVVNAGGGGGGDGIQGRSGAGSGGSLLIEAPMVLVAGKVAANGGGSGFSGFNATTAATTTKGDSGGAGSGGGGDTIDGSDGALGPDGRYLAAGGGGVGRIRINTATGAATISGTVSPTLATPCATQGMLAK